MKNYDVFISCKSEDYNLARQVHDFLSRNGYNVFLADAELRIIGRAKYGKVIDEALESTKHLILFASKLEYVRSTYVEEEWRLFLEEQRSGRKTGNLLTICNGFDFAKLPISLRNSQTFTYDNYQSSIINYLPIEQSHKPISRLESQLKPSETDLNRQEKLALSVIKDITKVAFSPVLAVGKLTKMIVENISESFEGTVYKVGDYYDDGTKQGVVFEVWDNGRHGKIVSLDQASMKWATKSVENNVTGADSRIDGAYNLQQIQSTKYWSKRFPAFAWCVNKGNGWYLPAIDELATLVCDNNVRELVNATLKSQHAEIINTQPQSSSFITYVSSTEMIWDMDSLIATTPQCSEVSTILFYDGEIERAPSFKSDTGYVRAVATF